MSKVVKKIFKGIKKVFKKITKVVKKIVKSKIFKVVAIGAAVIFGGMALAGALGGGAATTTGLTSLGGGAFTTVPANIAGMSGGFSAASGVAGITASSAASGGIMSGLAAAGSWAGANPLLASTALNLGGSVMSGVAQAREADKERKRIEAKEAQIEKNKETRLSLRDSLNKYGNVARQAPSEAKQTTLQAAPVAQPQAQSIRQNIQKFDTGTTLSQSTVNNSFYDEDENEWRPVA